MSILKFVTGSALLALVAACSNGTSSASPEPTPFEAFLATNEAGAALSEEIGALSNTAFNAIPTTGAVSFQGYGGLIIETGDDTGAGDIFVVGDAELTADFDDNSMTGQVDNLAAAYFGGSDVLDVTGAITIGGNQSFLGDDFDDNFTDRPNQWFADYAGDLTIEGDLYEVEGALTGDFRGTRANPAEGVSAIKAISAIDDEGFAVVNGAFEEVGVVFEVIADN